MENVKPAILAIRWMLHWVAFKQLSNKSRINYVANGPVEVSVNNALKALILGLRDFVFKLIHCAYISTKLLVSVWDVMVAINSLRINAWRLLKWRTPTLCVQNGTKQFNIVSNVPAARFSMPLAFAKLLILFVEHQMHWMELAQVALMDIRLKAQNVLLQNNRPEIHFANNSMEKSVSNVLLDLISTLKDCANFLMRLALLTTRSLELALLAIQATKFWKESAK